MHTPRPIITAAIIAALPAAAHGAILAQSSPSPVGLNLVLGFEKTNDDPGAVYDSAELQGLFLPLAQSIYAFGSNAAIYASVQDMTAAWSGGITGLGSVSNGWSMSGFDPKQFTNIGGLPDITYDQWVAGRTGDFVTTIPLSQLTASGNAADWGDPDATYATITLSDTLVEDAFVGKTGGVNSPEFFADGFAYQLVIIPAPGILALAPLAALTTTRRRR